MPDPLIESIFQFKKNVAVLKLYREVKAMMPLMNYETSFVGIIKDVGTAAVGLKVCAITKGIKNCKSIIK